jgi:hypothetical protein
VANQEVIASPRAVALVIDELTKVKIQDGASARYREDLHTRLRSGFAARFGDRLIHEVTHSELEDYLRHRDDWSPVTRNNYGRLLSTLFSFALARVSSAFI